jgi:hypothetical protein
LEIRISNTLGQTVRIVELDANGDQQVELQLEGLNAGTYFVQVPSLGFRKTLVVK